ncbi:hypothetical protein [Rhizobium grahamii]|uniref:hypothetical protein n=1 Tax=Rhizobium grahamii TaxID=1120045 RepID=UPI001676C61B|nr:hypothetical protein [Rhizobium grahamii]
MSVTFYKTAAYYLQLEGTSHPMPSTTAQRLRTIEPLLARRRLRLKNFLTEDIGPETLA